VYQEHLASARHPTTSRACQLQIAVNKVVVKAHKPKTSEEPGVADNRVARRVVEVETPEPRPDGAETPEVKGVGAAKPVAAVAQQ